MSSMKQRFSLAVDDLYVYYGIKKRSDLLGSVIAGEKPEDQEAKILKIIEGTEKINPNMADICDLFQSQERAFYAHQIAEKLTEFKSAGADAADELENSINVICEPSVTFGKLPWVPKGFKDTPTTSLNKFSSHLEETGEVEVKTKAKGIKEPEKAAVLNKKPKEPTKSQPVLSSIIVNSSLLNPGQRQVDGASIFLNAVPTMEMSRCVPYLDVLVNSSASPLSSDGKINTISLLQFFGGNFKAEGANKQIAESYDISLRDFVAPVGATNEVKDKAKKGELGSKSSAGMEIFTSPQTLVNGYEQFSHHGNPLRQSSVIDKFRPLLSISDFKVDVASSVGLIAMKTASLNLILHDRSRMGEVAEFIKPDLFNQTELIITYGWSHPNGLTGGNVWGRFLDSLKCTEKYAVVNSQFSFDEVGQVNISLKLSLKGSTDRNMTTIADGDTIKGPLSAMKKLEKAMKLFRKQYPKAKEFESKNSQTVFYDFKISDVSTTNSIMGLDDKAQKGIETFIEKNIKGESSDSELAAILEDFLKEKEKLKEEINRIVNAKVNSVKAVRVIGHDEKPEDSYVLGSIKPEDYQDPFALEINRNFLKINTKVKKRTRKGKKTKIEEKDNSSDYTSLGALMMQFIGRPLAATNKFNEVQFVFYPFNGKASYVANTPISHFPIKIEDFKKAYQQASKVTPTMSLGKFISFLGSNFISVQHADAYGMSNLYKPDEEDSNKMVLKDEYAKDQKSLLSFKEERLCDAAGEEAFKQLEEHKKDGSDSPPPNVKFTLPRVQMVQECLKGDTTDDTILRIHIFDAAQSSFSTLAEIWKDAQSNTLSAISSRFSQAVKENDASNKKKAFTTFIQSALEAKVIEYVDDPGNTTFTGDADADKPLKVVAGALATKNFIKKFIPSIDYGNATSNIIGANVSSAMTPGLGDINMIRSGLGTGLTSLGSRDSGLPLAVAPVQLSISSMGFPFAAFAQQFFIDFNTGTNVDNIYRCSKVSHSISPGEFKTDMSFHQINAYGQYTNMASQISTALKEIKSKK